MGQTHQECPQCGRPQDGGRANCPQCGNPLPDASRPSDVPPALAISVVLGLIAGVMLLVLLVGRFVAKPEPHATAAPMVPPSARAASPAESARPSPKPVARATPVPLPGGPAPGQTLPMGPAPGGEAPSIGMPPPAPIPSSPVTTGPRYPGPP
jgi:hypothetical protein